MRIVCPACSAAYEVPDRLLGTGKRLRCARCAQEWAPPEMAAQAPPSAAVPPPRDAVAPSPPPEAPARPAPSVLQADPKPRPPPRPPRSARGAVLLALAASLLVLGGLLAAGVVWRAAVMQAFPPARLLFRALGLE